MKNLKPLPDLEYLRSILRYDPETGEFRWLDSRGGRAQVGGLASRASGKPGKLRRRISIDGIKYLAHRVAWLFMTGETPPDEIDHWDGDSLNNRWVNLRAATHSQNLANQKRAVDNRTGFKGVRPSRKVFCAIIKVKGKAIYLGCRKTPEEAHELYAAAAKEHFGEFARIV